MARMLMIDGRLLSEDQDPRIALDDGLVRGDGVFEGMRTYGRRPRTPAAHLDRLARSAKAVGIDVDRALLEDEMARFCASTSEPECGLRLMLTRGGQRIWREEQLPPPHPGMSLLPLPHRVTPLLVGAKTLSYAANMQARRRAREYDCDDALLVRADDAAILEGPVWSFGWLEDGAVVFPPLELGVLDSITRRLVGEALPVVERHCTARELERADGALVISTVQEAQPVAEVRGVTRLDPGGDAVREAIAAIRSVIERNVVALT